MPKSGAIHAYPVASYLKGSGTFAKGLAVKLASTKNTVDIATAGSQAVHGVVYGEVDTVGGGSANVAVQVAGFVKVKLGGTVAIGDKLVATTAGAVIKTTTATDLYFAVAQEAGASGEYIEVLLNHPTFYAQDSV